MFKQFLCPFVLALCVSPLLAQSAPQSTTPPPSAQTGPGRRGNMTPCWQQAGIEKSVMEQRWSIERDTRSQIEAVCSNSSLTPQQKHQQVKDLRLQARQKMDGLVTPEQEKALTSCQQQRGFSHPGGGGMNERGGMNEQGGCGEGSRNGQRPGATPNGGPGSGSGGNTNPPTSPQN